MNERRERRREGRREGGGWKEKEGLLDRCNVHQWMGPHPCAYEKQKLDSVGYKNKKRT